MTELGTPSRRERLVQAALRVMERDGLAATSTRAIAREAGVSSAAVQREFGGFGPLASDVVEHLVAAEGDAALWALITTENDVVAIVREALRSYLHLVQQRPGAEQTLLEVTLLGLRRADLDGLPERQYERYLEVMRELLAIVARRADIRWDVEADQLARFALALTDGVTLAWLVDRDDAAAERTLELAAETIAAHARSRQTV
ncbi:TetR/AcrR family transcriptional regulator [Schumannella soli]|uniref:TetR family transcriptional regulator n=1 Tax=Schumannella soli TaxID=2590779 RepID=A0A506Y176_9MICO|nr:TetR/AcrR family transcriptional regulator [Schumannella soli]TPW75765.1 TetR family transcriptional regulator [Schumannella soli]